MPTIRPEDISFGPSGLSAGPLSIAYDAVSAIRFEYTSIKIVPFGGTIHHPEMEVFIKNQTGSITVRLPRKFMANPVTHTEPRARQLVVTYEHLAEATFFYRLTRYTDQIAATGGFAYDKKQFMQDGTVLSTHNKPIMNIRERKLFRLPDRIECREKEGVMAHVARFVPITAPTIRIRFDRDVFFVLLDRLYGIRW